LEIKKFQLCQIEPDKATRAEIESEIQRLTHIMVDNKNLEQGLKIFLNSIYGAIGNQYFVCYNPKLAEAVTLQGQDLIKFTSRCIDKYFMEYWATDTETHKKMGIDVAHVEGGIRSGDMSMPEEVNRIVTDSITDHFFTTSEIANQHLRSVGVAETRIHFVGNTMIDTLYANESRFIKPKGLQFDDLKEKGYLVLTMHRPANVDGENQLKAMIETILENTEDFPIIFPVHPRTAANLSKIGIQNPRLRMVEPLSYLEFNYLVQNAKGVITDSGGVTEEASVMNVPCITLRDNTERPETITHGTNELVGTDPSLLEPYLKKLLSGNWKTYKGIPMWDGKSADRIVSKIIELYSKN
jgi:UDP-N-acetylglucosamine 2-epimerase (non-hydrolysing)